MCVFCGSPDPLHGLSPAPVLLAGAGALSLWARLKARAREAGVPAPDARRGGASIGGPVAGARGGRLAPPGQEGFSPDS